MSITVKCSNCGASSRAKDEQAGHSGKCPKCHGSVRVPQPRSKSGTTALTPADLQRKVLGAFEGPIESVEASGTYKLGILLVSVVMVALPLVYVGLIFLACYLLFLHAVYDASILSAAGSGRGFFFALLVYFGPLLAGGILILFMIKPLFASSAERSGTRSLTPTSDPLLFAFVARVCAATGSPQPVRIDVNCEANAFACFRRGMLSMFGNDLVLTIGMPLAGGLNLRQFAGVLAHEFGHFSQGAGMRLTYLIRTISMWFTRVVYERDEWDVRLVAWSKGFDIRFAVVFHLARLLVWLTRWVLWGLMLAGHAVAGFMLRQMEFDADRYEARLAGSETVESTSRRIAVLSVASEGAQADLHEFYKEGRLGDDLPRLILANVDQIPAKLLKEINKQIDETQTGLFDTHPAAKDRIASAREENAEGVFRLEFPATILFTDFKGLSRNVTWDFYRQIFGQQFKPSDMHPVDDLLARMDFDIRAGKAMHRFFQGTFSLLRPLQLPAKTLDAPDNPGRTARVLKEARQRTLETSATCRKVYKVFDEADTHAIEADQAEALLSAKFRVSRTLFSIPLTSPSAVSKARADAANRQQQADRHLVALERVAAVRLIGGLRLLYVPQVAERLENPQDLEEEVERLFAAVELVNGQIPALLALRNANAAMGALLSKLEGNEENQVLMAAVWLKMRQLFEQLADIRKELYGMRYPLDHAKGKITIGEYALAEMPPADHLGAIFDAADEMLGKMPSLYVRLVGRLAMIAEQVEKALGLEPLPEPPEESGETADKNPEKG